MVPRLNVLPGARLLVMVAPLQLSVMVGAVQFTTAWQDALADARMFPGQFRITGAIASKTVTVNVHVAVFPAASVAV